VCSSDLVSRAIAGVVGPDGSVTRTAIARDFSRAYRETLLYELFIFVIALAVLPLLPKPEAPVGHGGPAAAV